jgi:hypothetical protein
VRVLALAAIVAQIVPGGEPGLYRNLIHTNVFLCRKGISAHLPFYRFRAG